MMTQPQKFVPRGNYPLLPIRMGFLVFLTIFRFACRTPIAHIRKCRKKGDCLHNNFDFSCFVQASTNELPSKSSGFVAILEKACNDRTNVINASKKKKIKQLWR